MPFTNIGYTVYLKLAFNLGKYPTWEKAQKAILDYKIKTKTTCLTND